MNKISKLIDNAAKQKDIQKLIIEAVFEENFGTDIFEIDGWSNLSKKSEIMMFGKQIPDVCGALPGDEDYEDTRSGELFCYDRKLISYLIKKVKDNVLKKI